jgi:hypothetical protein
MQLDDDTNSLQTSPTRDSRAQGVNTVESVMGSFKPIIRNSWSAVLNLEHDADFPSGWSMFQSIADPVADHLRDAMDYR